MSISTVITTKNEAKNIARCVHSLYFADEIIVVDDFSQDETVSIAEKLGTRIIKNKWEGFGQQKNVGLSHAQFDWVLFVDADEEVSPALAHEIKKTLENPQYDVYWLRVLDIFLGKPLRHLTGNNPRLLRRGKARWTARAVHEQVELIGPPASLVRLSDNQSGVIAAFLFHHSHTSIASYLKKMHRYTTLDAEQMAQTHRHRSGKPVIPSMFLPLRLAVRQFIKLAFWRRGALDGYPGCMWAALSAYYEWEMAQKYLKLIS